jgi:Rrf2 family iron-sulfur cluster assembly transcriptional regulator
MTPLSRRSLFTVTAVVDIALHARPSPVAARALAERHNLAPRHLEPMLQALVREGILKGTRGPRGGYELARERRRITVADILRAAGDAEEEFSAVSHPESALVDRVVRPVLTAAVEAFLAELARVTVEDLCKRAGPDLVVQAGELHDIGL